MDRQIAYPGQLLPETNLLQSTKDAMIGLAKLSAAMLGTSTVANGFAVTPTGPASLQVLCAPGEIYSLTSIDALAFSTLPADTTHSIMKQGILLDGLTLNCPAPGTTGQSINYLIQATYQDTDATPVLLPYYNSANPSLPFSGMGNNGLTQNTVRKGSAIVSVKAGASATTGSQVTPAPDAGYVGLYVVTVAFGQSTITSPNIARYSAAPLLPSGLVQAIQQGTMEFAVGTGSANTYSAAYAPAITTLVDGLLLRSTSTAVNTGASTFSPNGVTAKPIVNIGHSALTGGELPANSRFTVQYSAPIDSWVLLSASGASALVSGASIGSMVNAKMQIPTASATATFTADEIPVKNALGGATWTLSSFSASINLATTGVGGMDTGSSPVSGFVAIYAIYNPATGVSGLLAANATAAAATEVYSGANMPAGYRGSALVSVCPTNGSGQIVPVLQFGRAITLAPTVALSTSSNTGTFTPLSISTIVPKNAKTVSGLLNAASSVASAITLGAAGSAANNGMVDFTANVLQRIASFADVPIFTTQVVFYQMSTGGTSTNIMTINRYSF